MLVLVTGATGRLGRAVVSELVARVHAVRILTRQPDRSPDLVTTVAGDITADSPLAEAVDGVEAIVHCATDPGDHRRVDALATERMVAFAARAGRPHIVYPGIVGSDVVPLRYHRSKQAAEESLIGSGLPTSIVRATHFNHHVWSILERMSRLPLMPVPRDTRLQPIDPVDVAAALADVVEHGPVPGVSEMGGPNVYEAADLARSHKAATGHRSRILTVNYPGITGAALRAGAALTSTRVESGRTWNDFVASQLTSDAPGS